MALNQWTLLYGVIDKDFTEFRLSFSVCVIHMLPETKTGLESSCESFDLLS